MSFSNSLAAGEGSLSSIAHPDDLCSPPGRAVETSQVTEHSTGTSVSWDGRPPRNFRYGWYQARSKGQAHSEHETVETKQFSLIVTAELTDGSRKKGRLVFAVW